MDRRHSRAGPIHQGELLQYLFETEGLIELILSKDLTVVPISKLYNCLVVTKNLVSKAIEISEQLLSPLEQPSITQLHSNPLQNNIPGDTILTTEKNHKFST